MDDRVNTKSLPAAVAIPQPCEGGKPHDPSMCWWCKNPQSETEVAHMLQYRYRTINPIDRVEF